MHAHSRADINFFAVIECLACTLFEVTSVSPLLRDHLPLQGVHTKQTQVQIHYNYVDNQYQLNAHCHSGVYEVR